MDNNTILSNITVNITFGTSNYSQSHDSSLDATAPVTSVPDTDNLPPSPVSPGAPFNPNALALQTFYDIQLSNTNSALFGALTALGIVVLYSSYYTYYRRRKPIYLLNALQASLIFIKTISATLYAVMVSGPLSCSARSPLVNIPMVLAWDLIYGIMLIKLLLFTQWKRTCQVVVILGSAAHFAVVLAGIIMRKSSVTALGLCADKYPVVFKHQYDIELFLEVFTTGMLLQGIASRQHGVFEGTQEVFRQLAQNEHVRVFFSIIFVTLKIIFAYGNFNSVTAVTHAIDSARSAIIAWAVIREHRRVRSRTKSRGNTSGAAKTIKSTKTVSKTGAGADGRPNMVKATNMVTSMQDVESLPSAEYEQDEDDAYVNAFIEPQGGNDKDASRETVREQVGRGADQDMV
ncbi:uncharacterized protein SPPG_06529 [Spizellomyces punctatus DAOM BR117]|uniref:G-protein coupled receptors family 3 profile domain-containing protein n=1 Tax=Spizellomyces punctatus (strain DAOM BR117) TaxID=645134 RepID=A0A0L0H9B7_SPIPD|nr:uncharacterized protein SPPG_06529 [Spizellomyces punctatus DAOM BR117]KNC98120.1 hypothetical protein SPPG_06529 [Spizellomyces punctatus DAOM BR117]|eukprot:XP_016606160.1 hypothetical protein SPPG_06529 [Spizellomyces punctatus DAOM BR117]